MESQGSEAPSVSRPRRGGRSKSTSIPAPAPSSAPSSDPAPAPSTSTTNVPPAQTIDEETISRKRLCRQQFR
ncbi:unnamed protein product [Linum trigynum]|uniref:Uncharacterized protein n=1 Tax=Linum trigynum TaxID=586398 RepID=A0AAV2D9G2_9ROSI